MQSACLFCRTKIVFDVERFYDGTGVPIAFFESTVIIPMQKKLLLSTERMRVRLRAHSAEWFDWGIYYRRTEGLQQDALTSMMAILTKAGHHRYCSAL